jgi:hypothetical protein
MAYLAPSKVAIAICPQCGALRVARWVNKEDEIPPRFCSRDGQLFAVHMYTNERPLPQAIR